MNGVLVGHASVNEINATGSRTNDGDQTPRIGLNNNGVSPFNGLIDDVRVYNRILTTDEIKRLYNLGR